MAQKAFVSVIEMKERRVVTLSANRVGWERFQATITPGPAGWVSRAVLTTGPGHHQPPPLPCNFWPRGASINVSFP